ncbi:MAG: 3-oxoacyl-[acyl-carrier-protein] reductase [Deltaproteobacteria bacterium]
MLEGRIALVTGGSRGIGRAVCQQLAAMGAVVIVNYVSQPDAAEQTVAGIIKAGGRAEAVQFNIGDGEAVQLAFKAILEKHGQIDILVNNAGITKDGLLATMKEESWDAVLDTNLKGAFFCTKAAARAMMKKRWGRIVNISSVVGATGNPGQANYAAAKAGLIGFTKSVAREYASRNITVNAVAPGYIETDMTNALDPTIKERLLNDIPLSRLGSAADVAQAVCFLCGEGAGYITGHCLHVNGGMYMA